MERKPRRNTWSKKAKLLSTLLAVSLLCTTIIPGSVFAQEAGLETEPIVAETVEGEATVEDAVVEEAAEEQPAVEETPAVQEETPTATEETTEEQPVVTEEAEEEVTEDTVVEEGKTEETVEETYAAVETETESPVAAYVEELSALLEDAKVLDAEAEDLNNQCADIYDAAMAVYDEAYAEWEADVITDDEFAEVEEATAAVWRYLADEYGYDPYDIETYGPGDNDQQQPGGSTTATSGTSNHIEIEISGTVTVKIGDETITVPVTLTTSDTYTVSAYTLNSDGTQTAYTGFTYTGATEGNGSTADSTVELSGSYPTGTHSNQVYYVVSVVKTVSVTLEDGTELNDIPVTLTVTTSYWDEGNNCPGIHNSTSSVTSWQNGNYIGGSGIDVPISGEYVGQAITKGKLAITKTVTGEEDSTATFQFYLQNASGEYLTFSGNAYTGTSETLTDACKVTVTAGDSLVLTDIPVGTYTITEIQKNGYIITDAEGNESDDYTKDYIVETKSDDEIPIANFTNKKLENEAGIKIKKVGYRLSSYPNPTVAIYSASDCTNGVPNDGATAVWEGTLETNSGEFIYLNTTLPAGNYVLVETGADVEGYNLTTTLTVDGSADSDMEFTAVNNSVHELVVTNTYAEKPKLSDITITKSLAGNMYDTAKDFTFTATYVDANGDSQTKTFTLKGGQSIKLEGLLIGSQFTITETDYSGEGYTTTVDGTAGRSKTVTVEATNESIEFVNTKDVLIDTNVFLDNTPYILALGVVLASGTAMIFRRRKLKADK